MTRRSAGSVGEDQLALDLPDVPVVVRRSRSRPAKVVPTEDPAPRISADEIAARLGRPRPTAEQARVIEAPLEPQLVIAGAGSGKTETMAARVVWLVANGVVAPDQVLGLTFTRKAAGELAERVRSRLRALERAGLGPGGPGGPGGTSRGSTSGPVSVQTYHSYAAGVLGDHSLRLGIEPGARLLGEAGAWQLVDDLVESWDGDMSGVDSARATVVEAVLRLAGECAEHLADLGAVEALCASLAERLETLPAQVGDAVPGPMKADVRAVHARLAARARLVPIVRRYVELKRERELLDFGDQVALAAQLARDAAEVGEGERQRYRVVLLDEYQDTSHAQVVLLQNLFGAGHPVTAVGDPHQSIYAWRGASAGNLQRFGADFPTADGRPAAVAQLSTSWRNDHAVLSVANAVAGPLRVPAPWSDPAARVEVGALSAGPAAGAGEVRAEWHETLEAETGAVADWAAALWAEGSDGGRPSVAVLCRARSQFPAVEAELRKRGLPVEVIGLGGLLHVPEIADLRAALEVVHDPGRGDSLARLVAGASCRLGPADLEALGAWSKQSHRERTRDRARRSRAQVDAVDEPSVIEALDQLPPSDWTGPAGQQLSQPGRHRLERLAGTLRGLRARLSLPLPDLVQETERALLLDVEVAARPGVDPAAARAHLDAFVDVAAAFEENGERPTLGSFLSWLSAAEQQERGLDTGAVEQPETAVQLLTVHGAKGLEWDAVAVTGLCEGTFPAGSNGRPPVRSNAWLTELGALPYPLRGDALGLPQWHPEADGSQEELAASLNAYRYTAAEQEVAEERRLAYVAVTRARHRLLLTGALWGDGKGAREPSRFLSQVAELAGQLPGVSAGSWAEAVDEGAVNPRELDGAPTPWPVDPLAGRRQGVEEGAALVVAAIGEIAGGARLPAPVADDDEGLEELGWSREVDLLLAERDAARDARAAVSLPTHLSASRLVALAADPAALALTLRRPMPAEPSPEARRGSRFHAWLERRFGAAALLDVEEMPGAGDDEIDVGDAELARLQQNFLASQWAGRMAEAVEVSVETPVGGVVLRGRIDAVFRNPDGSWDVVDWKTGAKPVGERAEALAVQLAVYRLAWSRLTNTPLDQVRASFFYAGSGETVRPVDLLDEPALRALLESALTR
ncbi:ATP-dependent helicase [Spongisporangium articulatum]|uniref:DNA 3'-5' helicase n=1 Tax=Spongisporangium articulatum TaxID=3362603 RepID=A0ABW8APX3_9ACTN